jgi:hypothetical protein
LHAGNRALLRSVKQAGVNWLRLTSIELARLMVLLTHFAWCPAVLSISRAKETSTGKHWSFLCPSILPTQGDNRDRATKRRFGSLSADADILNGSITVNDRRSRYFNKSGNLFGAAASKGLPKRRLPSTGEFQWCL